MRLGPAVNRFNRLQSARHRGATTGSGGKGRALGVGPHKGHERDEADEMSDAGESRKPTCPTMLSWWRRAWRQ
jgi:hypothetical protein